jgi:hypothetical protein
MLDVHFHSKIAKARLTSALKSADMFQIITEHRARTDGSELLK